jgi:triosephosphate isomerase (TIM)
MKKRKIWVAGNWKMNHSVGETTQFFESLQSTFSANSSEESSLRTATLENRVSVALFPSMLSLSPAMNCVKGMKTSLSSIHIGSQNTHWETKGAFTGEVSGSQLRDLGVTLSLVGHSERRQYFGETNQTTKIRTESLLAQGFTVIHCIGETKEERLAGQTFSILKAQINEGLPESLTAETGSRLIIAYEPVWAIGTGLTATPEQAEEAHAEVRRLLSVRYGEAQANDMSVLYGGSVTPENFPTLLALPNVDGGLVGGASLKPDSFGKLVQMGCQA